MCVSFISLVDKQKRRIKEPFFSKKHTHTNINLCLLIYSKKSITEIFFEKKKIFDKK